MSAKIETWEQFMDEAKKLGLVAPAAPADATVERVMELADEYRGRWRSEHEELEQARAALRAEVERIVRERDEAARRAGECDGGYQTLEKELAAMKERAEAAEADARRYRWLRDRFVGEEGIAGHIDLSFDEVLHIHYSKAGTWPQGVDAAIDAAMEGK